MRLKVNSKNSWSGFFSCTEVLVSSGADAQLCVWNTDGWEKQKTRLSEFPAGRTPPAHADARVQFHQDQFRFLVVHETQLAIYEATKLELLKQWFPRDSAAPISHATFSCDSQLIFARFLDASVFVFSASNLQLRCCIDPSAYLSASFSSSARPLVIAAHPQEPYQFAVGLSDGRVYVIEPLESEGKWGVPLPIENGSASNVAVTSVRASSDEGQR